MSNIFTGANYRQIPAATRQPKIAPRAIILHSAAGRGSLYNWWLTNPNGLESHFWVSEKGVVEQYVPANVRADANGEANGFAISVETESSVAATEPWTSQQVAKIVEIVDWACRKYGIPRRLMNHPTDSGIAWHVQFGAPGPWTKARGKTCPGPARIGQVKSEIIPAVQRLGGGTPPKPSPTTPSTGGTQTVKSGSRGEHVKKVQAALNRVASAGLKVDGVAGNATITAIRNFQKFFGLTVDGIAGPETLGLLNYFDALKAAPAKVPATSRPTVRLGSKGTHVSALQKGLNTVSKRGLKVDGIFGAATESAVRDFQRFFKLGVDGIVGPKTWGLLDYLTAKA